MKGNLGLCVAINDYPGTNNDLAGCIADGEQWRDLFKTCCNNAPVTLFNKEATRANILEAAQQLLEELEEGCWGLFSISSHGTWVPDQNGDEPDGRDEALVPYDFAKNLILDDEIARLSQKRKPGTQLFLATDCCNSGTVYRMLHSKESPKLPKVRFMSPHLLLGKKDLGKAEEIAGRIRVPKKRMVGSGVVHFAGCQDTEFCYDAEFGGKPNGAFTYYALKALKKMRAGSSFNTWYTNVRKYLPQSHYPQGPKLNADPAEGKLSSPFNL